MNRTNKLMWLIAVLFFLNINSSFAQSKDKDAKSSAAQTKDKEDLFAGMVDVTWLGMDFSQAKFIGEATGFKDKGEVTNGEMRDRYIPGWNQLFINEMKKYDVAKQVHRTEVKYAIDVTDHANSGIKKDFFSNDPSEANSLDEEKVASLVKKYDYMGKKGIGMIFFVEGMSKPKVEASAWVAYINMDKKTVIMTKRVTGKPGGFGFKNYWAKSFYNILKDSDYKDWN